MRYIKPKPDRQERKCKICGNDEVGDEPHYLLYCRNSIIAEIRENFMAEIRKNIKQFENFSNENIIDYCMIMNDTSIQRPMAQYVKSVLQTYKEETEEKSEEEPTPPVVTRSGRTVKKPKRLDL